MSLITHKPLPLKFDVERLRQDLARIPEEAWQPHYNPEVYKWGWFSVGLIAAKGSAADARTAWGDLQPAPFLKASPYFQEVLKAFKAPLKRVRLLRLDSGAEIKTHVDASEADDRIMRTHIPVITHNEVEFFIQGERLRLLPGQAYFIETGLWHSVKNKSPVNRVHLVVDCIANEYMDNLLGFHLAGYRRENKAFFRKMDRRHQLLRHVRRFRLRAEKALRLLFTDPAAFVRRITQFY